MYDDNTIDSLKNIEMRDKIKYIQYYQRRGFKSEEIMEWLEDDPELLDEWVANMEINRK